MSSSFGTLFRVTTYGESHGAGVGVVVDGCPPGLEISLEEIQQELDRRRPGQSGLVSQRKESDRVEILSGISPEGKTLGTPIAMLVRNEDARSVDYEEMRHKFRPSHADFTTHMKYGVRDWRGGGRSSARETVGRVAAGAIAQKLLREIWGVEVVAYVQSVQDIATDWSDWPDRSEIDKTPVRCPDPEVAARMIALIEGVRKQGDTVGGVVACLVRGVPAGWGEPVFDKLEADLAKAVMSLPASKGFEIGSGFAGTLLKGSEHNDAMRSSIPPSFVRGARGELESGVDDSPLTPLTSEGGTGVHTTTNNSGGIQGGISNGMPITLRVAFKPVSTIMMEQDTVDENYENTTIKGKGRHDPCVLPRAVPMVEAMVSLVLADHALRQRALMGS
ncbi:MAG: chorismate synthase [Fimbriimonadaceae bacterium]|nr:chorismate synthase [Fimbriimonadaceae bacterium]